MLFAGGVVFIVNLKKHLRNITLTEYFRAFLHYPNLCSYLFKATGPNCFIVVCKILAVESNRQKHLLIAKTAAKTVQTQPLSQGSLSCFCLMTSFHCGRHRIYTNINRPTEITALNKIINSLREK